MIERRELVRALGRRALADWIVFEHDQELAVVGEAAPRVRRNEHRTRWQLVVHEDSAAGRGSAHVTIDAMDGTADELVDQAIALARASIGPAWISTPPAAPANVPLADTALARRELADAADGILHGLGRPANTTVAATIAILRETVVVERREGFRAAWAATAIRADALVAAGDHSIAISRDARQMMDLDLDAAIATATSDLALLAHAGAPTAGPCAIVLGPEALLFGGGLGVWAAFASQADAVVERQGLTRYPEHALIAPGADQVAEPLGIISDGALAFGVASAPLGDDGDAVRRFPLVEGGLAAGLGLSPREAALRKREPNGGVRNLVVAKGSWNGTTTGPGRVIEVHRLRDLAIDAYTGEASLEIALGVVAGKPFAGGTLRLDLIAAIAHAKRSADRIRRGPYEGPSSLLIDNAELIA